MIKEKFPCLPQQDRDAVDWHPWGDEAVAKTAAEVDTIRACVKEIR